jgi:hypothetical protein
MLIKNSGLSYQFDSQLLIFPFELLVLLVNLPVKVDIFLRGFSGCTFHQSKHDFPHHLNIKGVDDAIHL